MTEYKGIEFALIEKCVAQALKAWHTPVSSTDDWLLDFLIVQEAQSASLAMDQVALQRTAVNQVLSAGIKTLAHQDPQLARVLQRRFVDRETLQAVAYAMTISEQTVSRLQKKGIEQLAQIIARRESARRQQHIQQMEATLPPATYTRLFGVEAASQQLMRLLADEDGPAVIAVIGLGGIGKTALTDTAVRQIMTRFHFQNVIWLRIHHQTLTGRSHHPELTWENLFIELTAKLWPGQAETLPPPQRLAKLRQALTRLPHLIVIDNIESHTDLTYIVDQLHGFTPPTKFLLTSRSRLTERASVYNLRLQELSLAEATAFFRYHAQECGLEGVTAASDQDIAAVYKLTGGNPLALKLVIGLLEMLPLPDILTDLTQTHTHSLERMYRHIYRHSWQTLSDNGRMLLQAMPLVAESGGTLPYLAQVSGLAKEALWPALQELHHRSLIEVRGTLHEKRYGIHRLTHSFLCTEIINLPQWQSQTDDV